MIYISTFVLSLVQAEITPSVPKISKVGDIEAKVAVVESKENIAPLLNFIITDATPRPQSGEKACLFFPSPSSRGPGSVAVSPIHANNAL